jgi:BRCA1-associated protein
LICGYIGCSRYLNKHSVEHFKKTNHNYSLEIETRRVWDYAGDGYVHRLIASKGEITEIPNPKGSNSVTTQDEILEVDFTNKMDFICQEYNQLLSQQLESQRVYFERIIRDNMKEYEIKLNETEKNFQEASNENKKNLKKVDVLNAKTKKLQEEKEMLKNVGIKLYLQNS